tara:strand:- start:308 stop:850 length:543 start_codon:yes stop_codon:yes gene_type:complete
VKPFDTAWSVLKNFVLTPGKAAGFFNPSQQFNRHKGVSVNLAHPQYQRMMDDGSPRDINAYAREVMNPVFDHEFTHSMAHRDLSDWLDEYHFHSPEGKARRKQFLPAHEIAAFAMSQPATDPYQATRQASSDTQSHSDVMRVLGAPPFVGVDGTGSYQPKPIVSEDLPYEFPERYPEAME